MPRKNKCFSQCRKLIQTGCEIKSPKCIFTKGPKYKYCRLSSKYRMGENCIVTRKYLKSERTKAAKTVRNFILNTSEKRKAFFLKSLCSDSGMCIAFGNENNKIKQLFSGFTSFDYVIPPIKRIGIVSENGFINEIKYSRYGYDAYTILKSSLKPTSDNLMYEYAVGQYINKLNKKYPCFLETYGLFQYKNEDKWSHIKNTQTITTNVLKDSIDIITNPTYDIACTKSKYLAILIQHIKNAVSLKDKCNSRAFLYRDLLYILYQIYIVLYAIVDEFTHYDLHEENVLLYEPVKDKYIQYHYHYPDGQLCSFKSFYIAKIIDYGRAFFEDETTNSKEIYKNVCKTKECDPDCGEDVGFTILAPEIHPGSFHYISSQIVNVSHDLRLAYKIQQLTLSNYSVPRELRQLLDNVKYDEFYGTKQITSSGLPNRINNVKDMAISLHQLVLDNLNIQSNDMEYDPFDKLGDLHIYLDSSRSMQFIPV